MTPSQTIAEILPKKWNTTVPCASSYNYAVDNCQSALEAAIKAGKLCVVPSEESICRIIDGSELKGKYFIITRVAKSILTLMKGKND